MSAYSVTEPSKASKWVAGALVVAYTIITLLPLVWIISTSFKSGPDSISYPPKVIFEPSLEGYVNLFTTRTRIAAEDFAALPPPETWYDQVVRDDGMVIAGPSRFGERFLNSVIIGFGSTALSIFLGTLAAYAFSRFKVPLIDSIDFARFGRAPARFDEAELAQVNARILHQTPYEAVAERLPAGMSEAAWEAIRPNLERLSDAGDWWTIITGNVSATIDAEDRPFLSEAVQVADGLDWSGDVWPALTDALKASTGRKGKALFLPLRRALTGLDHGPDMKALLPLIGRERAVARLRASI